MWKIKNKILASKCNCMHGFCNENTDKCVCDPGYKGEKCDQVKKFF